MGNGAMAKGPQATAPILDSTRANSDFRHRSARTTARPIDVLNALSGFCSCERPAQFSR